MQRLVQFDASYKYCQLYKWFKHTNLSGKEKTFDYNFTHITNNLLSSNSSWYGVELDTKRQPKPVDSKYGLVVIRSGGEMIDNVAYDKNGITFYDVLRIQHKKLKYNQLKISNFNFGDYTPPLVKMCDRVKSLAENENFVELYVKLMVFFSFIYLATSLWYYPYIECWMMNDDDCRRAFESVNINSKKETTNSEYSTMLDEYMEFVFNYYDSLGEAEKNLPAIKKLVEYKNICEETNKELEKEAKWKDRYAMYTQIDIGIITADLSVYGFYYAEYLKNIKQCVLDKWKSDNLDLIPYKKEI